MTEEQQEIDWSDHEKASKINSEISQLREEVDKFNLLKKKVANVYDNIEVLEQLDHSEGGEDDLYSEVQNEIDSFKKETAELEKEVLLGGKYDKGGAILTVMAGAGGTEAQDWAEMLSKMYTRYAENKHWKVMLLDVSYGQEAGVKNITLEILGRLAYGYLKNESGVHRLVRQSPFNAKNLRHTSFALVEVLPIINDTVSIEINPADLKIDTYRASGPGGQNVNKIESAVRITHIPTGIVAACQTQRFQGANREKAMQMLYAKLWDLEQKKQKETKESLKVKAESMWGSQIRSYVLHPYKMIKDLRTGVEVHDTDSVLLQGNLDDFVNAELSLKK